MYLTYDDFIEFFPESDIPENQFEAFEKRAETDIDTLTFNRITEQGFENLTDFQKDRVRRSAAMQVKFTYDNSELLDSPLSAYSISGVSMSFDRSKVISLDGVTTTNQVYDALLQTGLCYRGLR
nr:MAG: Protein of unknown function (DUF3199) [Bacteriophage sp.]